MGVVTRSKKRRLEDEDLLADRISTLPNGILGDIVSLLPTKDGARTQVLSSRWRHIWRSAPLNFDLHYDQVGRGIHGSDISSILSAHLGPCRRFIMPRRRFVGPPSYMEYPSTTILDGWLRSPALDGLQELEFCSRQLLPSVHRFSLTLRVARFSGCSFLAGGSDAGQLHWPLLKQLTFDEVNISESSLQAWLAACPVLESLLLLHRGGFRRLQIVSSSLRSIGVHSGDYGSLMLGQLVIEDAPYLERLLYCGGDVNISVISAPRLAILGKLFDGSPRLQFGATVFQITRVWGKDWCTYRKLSSTLDIGLRHIVLRNYRGCKSHINLARFFVLNARVLESMRFEIEGVNISTSWIESQQKLLQIKNSASRGAEFKFLCPKILIGSLDDQHAEQVQNLSADPFDRFH